MSEGMRFGSCLPGPAEPALAVAVLIPDGLAVGSEHTARYESGDRPAPAGGAVQDHLRRQIGAVGGSGPGAVADERLPSRCGDRARSRWGSRAGTTRIRHGFSVSRGQRQPERRCGVEHGFEAGCVEQVEHGVSAHRAVLDPADHPPEHDDAGVGFRPVGAGHGREQPGCGRRLPPFGVDDPAAVVEVVGSAGGVEACGDRSALAAVPFRCGTSPGVAGRDGPGDGFGLAGSQLGLV